tara:strand:+ start:25637 stop:25930 length:294 start_codon:yes stop_codon:yes gene_type:complete
MNLKARIAEKFETYLLLLVSVVLAPLALLGFYAHMDERHDSAGTAEEITTKSEVRALKRERRKLETYLELSPRSEYTASRRAEIRALTDEIEELESK